MENSNIYWDSELYAKRHAFVYKYGEDLVNMLLPKHGEEILDLGCGNGHLTAAISNAGVQVMGIDASPEMIASAKENFPLIDFQVMDVLDIRVGNFDAVFSNAVLHWISEPEKAATQIFKSLKPGGRLIAEFGGKGNNDALLCALRNSFIHFGLHKHAKINFWYFPSIGAYTTLLEKRGFKVSFAMLFDRPTPLEGKDGIKDWFRMFGEKFFQGLNSDQVEEVLSYTQDQLYDTNFRDNQWFADYVRLRIVAWKPDSLQVNRTIPVA